VIALEIASGNGTRRNSNPSRNANPVECDLLFGVSGIKRHAIDGVLSQSHFLRSVKDPTILSQIGLNSALLFSV
jgi:hypothetical protein